MSIATVSVKAPTILITGGAGFLGKAIVEELLLPDSIVQPREIRVFDLQPYSGMTDDRITMISGDVRDMDALKRATEHVDLVIHSAAIIDWGTKSEEEVLETNVGGTRNVIKACQDNAVKNLIFTSSLDAVYTGEPLVDIDESQPYPEDFANSYCQSKTEGEQLVIAANGHALKTCILRPSDIYGEADPYHIEPLLNMAKSGFYTRLGNGSSKCQHVYVRNMAHAHILAADALFHGKEEVCGNTYFITDGPESNFFLFFDEIVRRSGYKIWPANFWLPKWLAYPMAMLSEFGGWLISPVVRVNVKFSRFAVDYTCTDFTFNSEKAKDHFGYEPKYGLEEALERTSSYYRQNER